LRVARSRRLSLTDDGQLLLGLARPVLDAVDGMKAVLGRQSSSPVGLVRIEIPVTGSRFLAPRLPALLAEHPGLKINLVVSDRLGDLIEDRLDLALRGGEITDSSLVARRAGYSARVAVAAPSYLDRHGAASMPTELAAHFCLVHDTGPDSNVWTFTTPEGAQEIRVNGDFVANDRGLVRLASRSGQGIAFLPMIKVFDDLRGPPRTRAGQISFSGAANQSGVPIKAAPRSADTSGDGLYDEPGAGSS